MKYINTVYG